MDSNPTREEIRTGLDKQVASVTRNAIKEREMRGLAIVALGSQIKRIDDSHYRVRSQSGNGSYDVQVVDGRKFICACPDYANRISHLKGYVNDSVWLFPKCKHGAAVAFSLQLRTEVARKVETITQAEPRRSLPVCRFCDSEDLIRRGFRKTTHGKIQRFLCKSCGRRFTLVVDGFHKSRFPNAPALVTASLDLYFKGLSLRKVVDHLKQFYGVKVSHVAVLDWIRKYTALMKDYVDRFKPEVSGLWHADEMELRTKREGYVWLWNLMDHETRFLLANRVTKARQTDDAKQLFHTGKVLAGKPPRIIVTDKLRAYGSAYSAEYFQSKQPRPIHVSKPTFGAPLNNTRIERFHNSVREREKVTRKIQRQNTGATFADGYRVYYNFVRPHMALNGLTPAEAARINLTLNGNKWESLIVQSAKSRTAPK